MFVDLPRIVARSLFYASFIVLPAAGWFIGNYWEFMSSEVLLFWAIVPFLSYLAIKAVLNEDPFHEAPASSHRTVSNG